MTRKAKHKTRLVVAKLFVYGIALCLTAFISCRLFHGHWYDEIGLITVVYWLPQWLKHAMAKTPQPRRYNKCFSRYEVMPSRAYAALRRLSPQEGFPPFGQIPARLSRIVRCIPQAL